MNITLQTEGQPIYYTLLSITP